MLRNLTQTFKDNCNAREVRLREYIVLDNIQIPIKAELNDDCYNEGNFVGTFIFRELRFETSNEYDFKKKEFEYYKVVNGDSVKIGTFITTEITDNDTEETIKVVAMDYGLKTQVEYTSKLNYGSGNVTLLDVWNENCEMSGLKSGITNFTNSNFIVDSDQFSGTGATRRDVFIAISQSSCDFVKIGNDDKIYLILKEETNEIIEEYTDLEDKRDTHPINAVSLGMSQVEGENVTKIADGVSEKNANWLVINDNPFAYTQAKRQQLINGIFNKINGFGYSAFKTETSFKPYLTCGDLVKFKRKDGALIDSIILRYKHNFDSITLEAPSVTKATVNYVKPESVIDIAKRTEISVNKQNQQIESIVSQTDEQNQKIAKVTQTVDELNSKISDVADVTISGEDTDAQVELNNINESEPIKIVIRPTGNNISYDYPHEDYPQEDFNKIRTIRFINTKTEEVFDYILPTDLLYYDNEHYDEFILDYSGQTCVINKKVGYNADGTTYLLDEQSTLEFEYPRILLTDGDYIISVLGYENAYLFVRLMAKNIYTTQFATRAELNSEITQTKNSITSEVTGKIDTLNKEINAKLELKVNTDNLISEINASADVMNLKSNRLIIESDNFKLTADGKITSTSGEIGGYSIDKTNLSANVGKKLLFPLETDEQYQQAYNKIYNHVYKTEILVGDELKKYDINKDGIIDKVDLLLLKRIYYGYEVINGNFSINAGEYENTLSFKDPNGNVMTGIDLDSITTQYLSAKNIFSCPGSATIDTLEITGTFTNNSDERLKKDIKELSNEYINIVKNTRPVEFTYKNNNTRHIGFIAQELEKSFKESKIEEIPIKKDELGIYSIDYISLIGILWKTNQDLYKKIENLEIKLKGDDSK